MDREEEEEDLTVKRSQRETDVFTSVCCLGCLSRVNLLVAVCVGMYVRWEVTDEPTILVIFILGLFVLGIASILHYYFAMEKASLSLFHLWFGFLLGLLCFLNSPTLSSNVKELVANYLLVASAAMKAVWAVTERICGTFYHKPTLLTTVEWLELLGFSIASSTLLFHKSVAIIGLVVALGALIVDLRMKSLLSLLNLIAFTLMTSLVFFPALGIPANPFALSCFLSRLLCEPVLDLYFNGLGPADRWMPVFSLGRVWRRLSLLPLCLTELAFFVFAALKLGRLELWYLVIPGFCIFGLFWAICHVILLITVWGFHTKLSECQKAWRAHRARSQSLEQVMASRGIRHFCLISERLVFFSLLSTVILGAVSWQASNGLFLSALLIVLPLESLAHSLFHELGRCLGGTCVGYALVIPTSYSSHMTPPVHHKSSDNPRRSYETFSKEGSGDEDHAGPSASPPAAKEYFTASNIWLQHLPNFVPLHKEKASANSEVPMIRLGRLMQNYHSDEQMMDETGHFWKKMRSPTQVVKEEVLAPGFEAQSDSPNVPYKVHYCNCSIIISVFTGVSGP